MATQRNASVSGVLLAILLLVELSHCQETESSEVVEAPTTQTPDCHREGVRMVFSAVPTKDGEVDSEVSLEPINSSRTDLQKPDVTVSRDVIEQEGRNFTIVRARITFVIPPRVRYTKKPTGYYKVHNTNKYPQDISKECEKESATVAHPITPQEAIDISEEVANSVDTIDYIWIGVKRHESEDDLFVTEEGNEDVRFHPDVNWTGARLEYGSCIAYIPTSKQLIDIGCETELPFVCMRNTGN